MLTRFVVALALACTCVRARAEDAPRADPPVLQISARSRRAIASTSPLDPTSSGTSLDVQERVSTPLSLGDIVRESAGARVLSTGGLGAFASLSLRGAPADETLVMLDEIPISTADGGAFDLSLFPAQLFERVNVYRGGAPAWLGGGAIGGVLQLIPRRAGRNGVDASATTGSYGSYLASAGHDVSLANGYEAHSQLVLRGARNDFPYDDQRATAFVSSDDREFRIKNADYQDASGFHDATFPLGRGRMHVLALGLVRSGGLSGPAAQPTPKVRYESARALTAASYEIEGGSTLQRKLQVLASGAYGVVRVTDLDGQLGLTERSATDNRSFRGFLRGAGSLELTRWLRGELIGTYSLDANLPHDFYVRPDPETSRRHTASGTAELIAHGELLGMRWELRPSVRVEWSDTSTHFSLTRGPSSFDDRMVLPTGRVGAVLELHKGVALSASYAHGSRLPTIYELFGDGGQILPSPGLRPVESTAYDGGVTTRGKLGLVSGSAELRGFWQERRDAIAMFRSAQHVFGHENLSRVHVYGIESRLAGEVTRWFRPSGAFTWLETETALGTRLPFRPKFVAFARPELYVPIDRGWLSSAAVSTEVWHRSFSFYDDKNLTYSPACTKLGFGAGLSMFRESVRIGARLEDALDQRCMDLIGFPISGRAVFFSLSYREVDRDAS